MNYLLDTHTFLWFINDDASLSSIAKALIEDPENTISLSVASIWEMPSPFTHFIDEQLSKNTIILLSIKTAHTGVVATLPFHHRDPFDRLIIAQSKVEDIPIIGKDMIFDDYGIKRLW